MISDNVTVMLWMLVFFVIFYLYIDIRITKLRKELLGHYMICEKMLSGGLSKAGISNGLPSVSSEKPLALMATPYNASEGEKSFFSMTPTPGSMGFVDSADLRDSVNFANFANYIPTKEETAYGLSNLKCTGRGCEGSEWLADGSNQVGSGFHPNGVQAYNINSESSDNYATFPPAVS